SEVSGVVFLDYDADGIQQAREPGLPGRTLFLDANGNGVLDQGERIAVTDSSGHYAFSGLPVDAYSVRQDVAPYHGVVQTSPSTASQHVSVGPLSSVIK